MSASCSANTMFFPFIASSACYGESFRDVVLRLRVHAQRAIVDPTQVSCGVGQQPSNALLGLRCVCRCLQRAWRFVRRGRGRRRRGDLARRRGRRWLRARRGRPRRVRRRAGAGALDRRHRRHDRFAFDWRGHDAGRRQRRLEGRAGGLRAGARLRAARGRRARRAQESGEGRPRGRSPSRSYYGPGRRGPAPQAWGSSTRKVVPRPGVDCTSISPSRS